MRAVRIRQVADLFQFSQMFCECRSQLLRDFGDFVINGHTLRDVANEENQLENTQNSQQDSACDGDSRHKFGLHEYQGDKSVEKCPSEYACSDLVDRIRAETLEQPRPDIACCQRENHKHKGIGQAERSDGRCRHNRQYAACAVRLEPENERRVVCKGNGLFQCHDNRRKCSDAQGNQSRQRQQHDKGVAEQIQRHGNSKGRSIEARTGTLGTGPEKTEMTCRSAGDTGAVGSRKFHNGLLADLLVKVGIGCPGAGHQAGCQFHVGGGIEHLCCVDAEHATLQVVCIGKVAFSIGVVGYGNNADPFFLQLIIDGPFGVNRRWA